MATHALSGLDMSPSLDPQLWARLERLAQGAGRSVSELAGAVLRDFVDENERQLAAIDAGIAAADAGDLIEYDEVKADVQAKLAALAARR
jgi:predicted transcriptional regulator